MTVDEFDRSLPNWLFYASDEVRSFYKETYVPVIEKIQMALTAIFGSYVNIYPTRPYGKSNSIEITLDDLKSLLVDVEVRIGYDRHGYSTALFSSLDPSLQAASEVKKFMMRYTDFTLVRLGIVARAEKGEADVSL